MRSLVILFFILFLSFGLFYLQEDCYGCGWGESENVRLVKMVGFGR